MCWTGVSLKCQGCQGCQGSPYLSSRNSGFLKQRLYTPDSPDSPDTSLEDELEDQEDLPRELVDDVVNLFKREGGSMGILVFFKLMSEKGYFRPQVEQYMPVLKAKGIIEYNKDTVKRVDQEAEA